MNDLEFEIRKLIFEMNDPRNDGYVTVPIKEQLKKIRSLINNALDEDYVI